ncbi:MAG: hypothetical protein EBQ89_00165, partial [Alphaproteobacteria bacterium]|nr:hypothetical protein [Alphaproteobacteria bacterium]
WLLVAGAHRLAAARQLGWATIAATVFAGSDDLALLREIDENLYRHTLNPLDEAVFLAMRAEIYRRLHPETAQWKGRLGQHAGPGAVPKARPFAADVAERTGIGRRTVERALTRFARLSPAARDAIRGTEIARSGAAIDLLCDIAPAHQAPVAQAALAMPPRQPIVKRLASAKAVELELAAPAVPDPLERAWVAYTRLSVEDRHTFIDRMRERGYLHRRRTGLVD